MVLGDLRVCLAALEVVLGNLGVLLGDLGVVLGRSLTSLGWSWGGLRRLLVALAMLLCRSWRVSAPGLVSGDSWSLLRCSFAGLGGSYQLLLSCSSFLSHMIRIQTKLMTCLWYALGFLI